MSLNQIVWMIGLTTVAGCSVGDSQSEILPREEGGLPYPFATELVDDTKDGSPDRTLLHSVGPMFYNGQERKPTEKEIEWYKTN